MFFVLSTREVVSLDDIVDLSRVIFNKMKPIFFKLSLIVTIWAVSINAASVVTAYADEESLFPLSIIHLNDFHAR